MSITSPRVGTTKILARADPERLTDDLRRAVETIVSLRILLNRSCINDARANDDTEAAHILLRHEIIAQQLAAEIEKVVKNYERRARAMNLL